ncbi:PD40 domain-containing protein, partial [bacterium]|nr:PD40 domain-containing protein [bacterium]
LRAYPHKLVFTSFINGNWEICLMNADGSVVRNLSRSTSNDVMPHVSPDGKIILFGSDRVGKKGAGPWPIGSQGRGIFIMNLDGGDVRQIAIGEEACWAPDGKRICFLRNGWLMIKDLGTGTEQRVGDFWSGVETPCWSPDGRSIALTADMLGGHNGHILDIATGRLRRYAFGIDANCRPDFSADGKMLSFCAHSTGGVMIVTVNLANPKRTLRRLTSRPGFNYFPDWSPDDKYIAYSHGPRNDCYEFSSGQWQIYVMTPRGDRNGPRVQLTRAGSNRDPDWLPIEVRPQSRTRSITAHD